MAYSISTVREKQMILLVFTGQHGPTQGLAGCREAAIMSQRENIHLILIDIREIDPCLPTTTQIHDVQSSLSDIFSKTCRIATVYDPSTYLDKNPRFSEDICVNRGLQFRIFTSFTAAEQWLLENRSPDCPKLAKSSFLDTK